MVTAQSSSSPQRVVVHMPTWVGDVVMATPTLAALRTHWPDAHLACYIREPIAPLLDAAPYCDDIVVYPADSPHRAIRILKAGDYDTAVLLPNSFRSAWWAWQGGSPRRIGYRRDWRGLLLTDKLDPPRDGRKYKPIPTIDYYLAIAQHVGADATDRTMRLHTRDEDDAHAKRMLDEAVGDRSGPLVLLNPGAATKGGAKLWPAERFAALADRLVDERGATMLVSGAPNERAILDAVHAAANRDIVDLPKLGANLRLAKSFIRIADWVVTNDTGPRHIAAALGTRVVSLFGPTDPAWTLLNVDCETIVQSTDDAMDNISVDEVYEATLGALDR